MAQRDGANNDVDVRRVAPATRARRSAPLDRETLGTSFVCSLPETPSRLVRRGPRWRCDMDGARCYMGLALGTTSV